MTIIVDASVVLAALTTQGPVGSWAEEQLLAGDDLAAPEHLYVEVANVLRRAEIANQLDPTAASLAFTDLRRMPLQTIPFAPLANRVWTLRANLTAYDAAYVAAAEGLGVPLITLDMKLVNAPGPTCEFRYPPSAGNLRRRMSA